MTSATRHGVTLAFSLGLACGQDGVTGSGSGTGDTSGTTAADTTTGPVTTTTAPGESSIGEGSSTMPADDSGTSTTGPDVELQHGFVRVQLERFAGQADDPFVGTERVQITLNYEQCIFDFYVEHPEWRPDGDDGQGVFGSGKSGGEGWYDRLCEVDVPDRVDCTVASIEQQLDPIPVLRITYIVTGELEGRVVPFGPLPTAALAACADDLQPTVRLGNGNLVVGFDGLGVEIWDGATFTPTTAATDDPTPIVVEVERES